MGRHQKFRRGTPLTLIFGNTVPSLSQRAFPGGRDRSRHAGAGGCPPLCRSPGSPVRFAAPFPACRPRLSPSRTAQPPPAARRGHFSPHSPSPLPQPRSPPPPLSPAPEDGFLPGAGVAMPPRRDTEPSIPRSGPVPPAAPAPSALPPPATGGTGRAGNAEP